MDSTPNFIKHYIDQVISEECVLELNDLSKEYNQEKKKLTNSEINRNGADHIYKKITGEDNPRSYHKESNALDKKFQDKAKQLASKYAEKESVTLVELKEDVPVKSIEEKSLESEKNLENTQGRMITTIFVSKAQKSNEPQDQNSIRKEKHANIVQRMQDNHGKVKEVKLQLSNSLTTQTAKDNVNKEDRKAKLMEQMKQHALEITQKKQLGE